MKCSSSRPHGRGATAARPTDASFFERVDRRGSAADRFEGNTGCDTLLGDSGYDTIFGNAGNDVIFAGAGVDYVEGNEDVRAAAEKLVPLLAAQLKTLKTKKSDW